MSDVDAIRQMASEHDLEFVDLDTYGVDPTAGEILPASLARQHHVVAVKRKFGTPVIATADPDDLTAQDSVRTSIGRDFISVVAAPDQIGDYLDQLFGSDAGEGAPEGGSETFDAADEVDTEVESESVDASVLVDTDGRRMSIPSTNCWSTSSRRRPASSKRPSRPSPTTPASRAVSPTSPVEVSTRPPRTRKAPPDGRRWRSRRCPSRPNGRRFRQKSRSTVMVMSRVSSRRSTSTRSPSRWRPSPNPSCRSIPATPTRIDGTGSGDPVDDLTFEELPPPPPPPPPEALAGTGFGEGLRTSSRPPASCPPSGPTHRPTIRRPSASTRSAAVSMSSRNWPARCRASPAPQTPTRRRWLPTWWRRPWPRSRSNTARSRTSCPTMATARRPPLTSRPWPRPWWTESGSR